MKTSPQEVQVLAAINKLGAAPVQKLAEHAGLKAHAVRYALQAMIDRKAIEPMPPPPNGVHRGDVPPNVKREA